MGRKGVGVCLGWCRRSLVRVEAMIGRLWMTWGREWAWRRVITHPPYKDQLAGKGLGVGRDPGELEEGTALEEGRVPWAA